MGDRISKKTSCNFNSVSFVYFSNSFCWWWLYWEKSVEKFYRKWNIFIVKVVGVVCIVFWMIKKFWRFCVLYGSENWNLTDLQRRRIEAAEMKLLRPLAGYTLYDYRTKDYIRCELQITGILDKIDEYRWNSLQHLQRMPQNRIPLKSYYYRPQGKRTIGRPKKRWREQL